MVFHIGPNDVNVNLEDCSGWMGNKDQDFICLRMVVSQNEKFSSELDSPLLSIFNMYCFIIFYAHNILQTLFLSTVRFYHWCTVSNVLI